MTLNSDVYASVLSQKKLIILVLDNGRFAVDQQAAEQHEQYKLQQPDGRLSDGP